MGPTQKRFESVRDSRMKFSRTGSVFGGKSSVEIDGAGIVAGLVAAEGEGLGRERCQMCRVESYSLSTSPRKYRSLNSEVTRIGTCPEVPRVNQTVMTGTS